MKYDDFNFQSEDKQEIFVANWSPDKGGKPKAAIQIVHGMAEHISRWDRFASYLTDQQFIVYGNDHRGHGKTAGILENVGYFGDDNGFQRVVDDLLQLTEIITQKHPQLPVFLFGHSMGSLLALNYITQPQANINGAILSGPMGHPGFLGKVGLAIARLESRVRGKRAKSNTLHKMSFGKFNTAFKPNRTAYDWLSRDNEEVDKYIADPYCGTVFTAGFYVDLISGIFATYDPLVIGKIPKELPLSFIAGEKDPVGDKRNVEKLYQAYRSAGLQETDLKFYPDARHELTNETNREEVFQDVVSWINGHLH